MYEVIKISKIETCKIPLDQLNDQIPSDTIGIDLGYSLAKIAYKEENDLILVLLPNDNNFEIVNNFLKEKEVYFNKFKFTGGKAFEIYKTFSKRIDASIIDEFYANTKGIEFLFLLEKKKEIPHVLIVSIGTGTSIVLKKDTINRLVGSALGGGFFMGLIKILFDINSFEEAITIAKRGNRFNIDLKVSDIYSSEDSRIDSIFKEFNAASLGKIDKKVKNVVKKEDVLNSLICLIGENIGLIANLTADAHNVNDIIFCGGFLKENKIIVNLLSLICMYYKKKGIFLKNSIYCGAIGVLLS